MKKASGGAVLIIEDIKRLCAIFTIAFVMGISELSFAQKPPSKDTATNHLSILLGLGPNYGFKKINPFSDMVSVRYEFGHWYIGLRYMYGSQSEFFVVPDETINDIGVLFGYILKKRLYYLGVGAGISYDAFVNRGKFLYNAYSNSVGDISATYEELYSHSIAIPIQTDAFWTPSNFFGIGVAFFDNINSVENNYGFLLSLKISLF